MTTHISTYDQTIYHDFDTIKDALIERGYTNGQAEAAIMNHMYSDSYRYTDRRWMYNRYVRTTNNLMVADDKLAEVFNEIIEDGIPTTHYQTGTPVRA